MPHINEEAEEKKKCHYTELNARLKNKSRTFAEAVK